MSIAVPSEARVGPYRFRVELVDEPFVSKDEQSVLCGECDHGAGVIRVLRRQSPDRQFVTYLHEIVHAIADAAGFDMEEPHVERFAVVLASFLTDNGYAERAASAKGKR